MHFVVGALIVTVAADIAVATITAAIGHRMFKNIFNSIKVLRSAKNNVLFRSVFIFQSVVHCGRLRIRIFPRVSVFVTCDDRSKGLSDDCSSFVPWMASITRHCRVLILFGTAQSRPGVYDNIVVVGSTTV